ncbi:MAG: hypothetical protein AAGA03_19025, partial [Planctomycetota bacterium]
KVPPYPLLVLRLLDARDCARIQVSPNGELIGDGIETLDPALISRIVSPGLFVLSPAATLGIELEGKNAVKPPGK